MTLSQFQHDGLGFAYAESGTGIPFIFQHGLGANLHQTFDLLGDLPGIRLIAMDARAHGASAVGAEQDLSFDTFGRDLLALFGILRLSQAIVGGLSMGAGSSLNFTLRNPKMVRALLLVRPAWVDKPMDARELYFAVAQAIRAHGAERGREHFRRSSLFLQMESRFPDTAKSLLGQFDSARAEDGVARLERLPADVPDRNRANWSNLRCPTLVLAHKDDPVHPLACGQEIAEAIPSSQFLEIVPKSEDRERHEAQIRSCVAEFLKNLD
jgi:pimeloyl-ACP methyl ester carboxylesterase